MQLDRCRSLQCEQEVTYLIIRVDTEKAEGGFCEEHAQPMLKHPIAQYRLEKMPIADAVKDRPVKTVSKPTEEYPYYPVKTSTPKPGAAHSPAPATKGPLMADMAPPDAVYDDDPGYSDDGREPAALDHEARAERRVLAEEMSSNFRLHIGSKQIFDVQVTLRGDYSSEKYRQFVRKLIGDIEFTINAGGRGTVRYAPGAESAAPAPAASLPEAAGQPTLPAAGAPAPERTSGEFVAKKIEIIPTPKGTTQIKFYTQGAQKPALTFTRRPENLVPIFEGSGNSLRTEHFEKAGEYTVSYLVRWKNSENRAPSGVFYRDIVSISPA